MSGQGPDYCQPAATSYAKSVDKGVDFWEAEQPCLADSQCLPALFIA